MIKRFLLFLFIMPFLNYSIADKTSIFSFTGFKSDSLISSTTEQLSPDIRIHYLGHSAFIFSFSNGVTILTDYGVSRAYGLASPIYDVGEFIPTIVIYSHHHPDHDRGTIFPGAKVVDGVDLYYKQINIKAIQVSENNKGDNFGYLITYKDFTIFHAGDCQGDIVNFQSVTDTNENLKDKIGASIDLLLLPVDWKKKMVSQAVAYTDFLKPHRIIPMHYWSPGVKNEFIRLYKSTNDNCKILETGIPDYDINLTKPSNDNLEIISLTPGLYK